MNDLNKLDEILEMKYWRDRTREVEKLLDEAIVIIQDKEQQIKDLKDALQTARRRAEQREEYKLNRVVTGTPIFPRGRSY